MWITCIDLESVLIPELWPALGKALKLPDLMLTTREIADKAELNSLRLRALKKSGVTVRQMEKVLAKVEPLPGAANFLQWLQAQMSVVIVSDCYRGLAAPVLKKLGNPAIICHEWIVKKGRVVRLPLRVQGDTKSPVVHAFQKLQFKVFSVGDSFNDLGMLRAADASSWFRPSERAFAQGRELRVSQSYSDLRKIVAKL